MGPVHLLKTFSEKEKQTWCSRRKNKKTKEVFSDVPANKHAESQRVNFESGMTRFQIFPFLVISFKAALSIFPTVSSVLNREVNDQTHKQRCWNLSSMLLSWLYGKKAAICFSLAHTLLTHLNLWGTFFSFMTEKTCLSPSVVSGIECSNGIMVKELSIWIQNLLTWNVDRVLEDWRSPPPVSLSKKVNGFLKRKLS